MGHLQEPGQDTGADTQPIRRRVSGAPRGQADGQPWAARSANAEPSWSPTPTRRLPAGEASDRDAWWQWKSTMAEVPRNDQLPASMDGPPDGPPEQPVAATEPARHRPWRRILAISLVLLVIVFIGLDRLAAHLAASQMVSQVQKSQHLPTKPEASVGGFPFLTQVLMGDYKDIGLHIRRVAVSDVCIDDINVHVKGVHIPLTKLISGDVKKVPIDRVVGSVRLTYTDLNKYLATQPGDIQLAPSGNGMRISAPVDVPIIGQIRVFGDVQAGVQDNQLTISPTALGIDGLGAVSIPEGAAQALTVDMPLEGLPMNLKLTSAKVTSAGIEVTAEADHLDLEATQTPTTQLQAC